MITLKYKKSIAILLTVLLTLSSIPLFASAKMDEHGLLMEEGELSEGIFWALYVSGKLVISGQGNIEYYDTLPWAEYDVYSVLIEDGITSVPGNFFGGNGFLTTVVLPEGITSIPPNAFIQCPKLKTVNIPEGVVSIGSQAFDECKALEEIKLPDTVEFIGARAFSYCEKLKTINIPDSVTGIQWGAFTGCSSLEEINIPEGIRELGTDIFSGCSSLTAIRIPDSVETVGNSAFYNCSGLTSVEIPDSVEAIGEMAFASCGELTDVYIPSSVTSIGNMAFGWDTALKNIYYSGSEEQWNSVTAEGDNSQLKEADFHFNASASDGAHTVVIHTEQSPTATEVGYTEGRYCNECEKYFSGHEEIPATGEEFTETEEIKRTEEEIVTVNGVTASDLISQFSSDIIITDSDGVAVTADVKLGTGMIIVHTDGTTEDIVVYGDIDGDAEISASDARLTLRTSVGLENYAPDSPYYKAASVGGNDEVSAADARSILRASVGLENPADWIK